MYFAALHLLVVLQILSTSVTAFAQEFLPFLIQDHSVALANTSISMFSVFSVNGPAEQQTVQFGPPQNDFSFQGRDQAPISNLNSTSKPSPPPRRKATGRSSHNRHAAATRSTMRSLTPALGAPVSSPTTPPSAPNFFESEQDAADFATAVNSYTETLGNSTSDHAMPSPESATAMPEPRHVNKLPSRSRRPTDAMALSLPLPTMSFPLEEEEEDEDGLDAELNSLLDNLDGKMPAMFSPEYEAEIEAQAAQAREITGIYSQPEPEPVAPPEPARPIRRLPKNRAGSSMMLPPPPIVDENPKETDKEPYIDRRDLDKNGRELSREVEAPFLPHSFRDDEIQAAQTLALVLATGVTEAPELPPLDLDLEMARLRAAITKKKADKAARALTKGMSPEAQKYMLESNDKLYQETLNKSRSATPNASPSQASSSMPPPPLPSQVSPSPTRMPRSSRRRCPRRDPFDDDDEDKEGAKDLEPIPKPDLSRYRTGYMSESKGLTEERYSFSPVSSTAMDSSKDISRQEQQVPKEAPSPEIAMSTEPLPSMAYVSPHESSPVVSPSQNTSDSQASSGNKMDPESESQEIAMECATQPLFGPSSIPQVASNSASMEADVLPLFDPAPTLIPTAPAVVLSSIPESMNVGPASVVYSNTSSLDPQMDTGMSAPEQSESMEADVSYDQPVVSSIPESMTVDPEPVVVTYIANPSSSSIPSAHVDEAMAVEIPTYSVPIQDSEMQDFEISSSSQASQSYVSPPASNQEQAFWLPSDGFIDTPSTPEATPKPTVGSTASYPTSFYSNDLDIAGSSTSVLFADAASFDANLPVQDHGSCSPCETPGLQVFLSPANEQAPLVNDVNVEEMVSKQPAPVEASQPSPTDALVVGKQVSQNNPWTEAVLTAPPTPVLPVSHTPETPETPSMERVGAGDKAGPRHGNVSTSKNRRPTPDILEIVELLENLHLSPGFWTAEETDYEVQPLEEVVGPGDLEAPSQEVIYKSGSDASDTESESDGSEASASSNWLDEDDYLHPMYSLEPYITKAFEWMPPPLKFAAPPARVRKQAKAVSSKRAADSFSFNDESKPTTRPRYQYRRPTPYPSKDQVPSVRNRLLSRLVQSVNFSRFF